MKGQQIFFALILCVSVLAEVTSSSTKESRTEGLNIPEKIIGGVIDIVQSHKNKLIQETHTYPPNWNYNYQQYPQYQQQWNVQPNFQVQGIQTQPQPLGFPTQPQPQSPYLNQGQYNYQNSYNQRGNYPQGGANYNPNWIIIPAGSGQTFPQEQNQQGQYQVVYQNPNQFGQPNNQFQNTQSGYYGQSQQSSASNQYQGSSTSNQGLIGQSHGQGTSGSGHFNHGFLTTSGQYGNGYGQGPTCVYQAWTKPQQNQEIFWDPPATEQTENKDEKS